MPDRKKKRIPRGIKPERGMAEKEAQAKAKAEKKAAGA